MSFAWTRPLARFDDLEAERRFAAQNLEQTLPFMRLAVAFGLALYAAFGLLDREAFPTDYGRLWLIRYGIVCPILVLVLVASFTPAFRRVAPVLMPAGVCVAGLGIVAICAIEGVERVEGYFAGVLMAIIFCSTLAGVRFLASTAVCIIISVAYVVTATIINPVPAGMIGTDLLYLALTLAFCVFYAFAQDYYMRRSFANAELLREEKARAESLLDLAREGSRAKSEFLALMSHELRTPLNAIIGFSDVMRQQIFGPIGSQRYIAYAEDIRKSGEHLLGVIDGILDLSMAESGALVLREEPIDLLPLIDEVTSRFRELARAKGVRLRFESPYTALRMMVDARLVRQAIVNLVSNGVKFTHAEGSVSINVSVDAAGDVVFRVVDTGIGIAAADLDRLDEPFVQAESAFARGNGGMGLGVPLTKKILTLHGGRLDIRSDLGVGTRVEARFPASRILSAVAAAQTRGVA